jgi:lambda repressor-like predicted transcriptional regulator
MESRLKSEARRAGLTLRAVALRAGIQSSLVYGYAGGLRPNQRNAVRVAEALGVSPESIWPEFNQLRTW